MWKRHLWNLLSAAWSNLLSSLSTSTLAVVIFSFSVPILIFAALVVWKVFQSRKSGKTPMNGILKGAITPSLIAALITMFAWICLFGWSVAATIYKDHQGLVSDIPKLTQKQAVSDDKVIGSKEKEIRQLKRLIPKFNPQCWMQSIPLPVPKNPSNAQPASEAVIVCNTELKARTTLDIFYDQHPSGVYFPVVVPDTTGQWGSVILQDKSMSVILTHGVVKPYNAFVVAVDGASKNPPVANRIQVR